MSSARACVDFSFLLPPDHFSFYNNSRTINPIDKPKTTDCRISPKMSTDAASSLPPDLFDTTTLVSLTAALTIVLVAYAVSCRALSASTSTALRFLFIWHLADALCHFILEGSFLYHCFFSFVESHLPEAQGLVPSPFNYLGHGEARVYGPQSGGSNPLAQLWMVYARADKRWGGADLGVISLELLTVFFDGPVALYVTYLIAKKDPKASFWMIVLATAELYGGKYICVHGYWD